MMTKAAAKSSVIKGVHLTFVLCVIKITRSGVVANEFRLSDNLFLPSSSFDDLAQEVCYEIGQDPPECIKQFLGPPEPAWLPSEIQVIERFNDTVIYNVTYVTPGMLQLVMLVHDKGYTIVKYALPSDEAASANVDDAMHYTFWTAVLAINGTHSAWREGPKLGPKVPPQHKEYNVRIREHYENSSYVRVNFKWSSGGIDDVLETDRTYVVANGCFDKRDMEDNIKIKAGQTPSFTIDVSPGDTCTFTVIGPDGNGEWQYKVGPQPIENITAVAFPSKAAWDVRVRWKRPPRDPQSYEVVLQHANFTIKATEFGNATMATFRNVTTCGYHNMTLVARFGVKEAYAAGPTIYIPRN